MFVPFSPHSELATKVRELEANTAEGRSIRFKVVERAGQSLRAAFQKSDPWANQQCGDSNCFPCRGSKGGDCRKSNVTYRIKCLDCPNAEYNGETGRNAFTRGTEHLYAYEKRSKDSALWAHCKSHHQSNPANFVMEVTGKYQDALSRQVKEGIFIHNFKGTTLNRKAEWRQPAVARVVPDRAVANEL